MATLCNPVIGLIRQACHTRIAATIRKIKNSPLLLLTILGLHSSPQTPRGQPKHPCALLCTPTRSPRTRDRRMIGRPVPRRSRCLLAEQHAGRRRPEQRRRGETIKDCAARVRLRGGRSLLHLDARGPQWPREQRGTIMLYHIREHFSRRRWLLGAAALLVLALVTGLTVGLLGRGGDEKQLVVDSAANLGSWRGVSYEGMIIDSDGVATAVALTVTREGAAHGTLTRDFGAQAEIAVDGSGTLLKGNRQWWLWERPGSADALAEAWIGNPPDDATGLVPVTLLTPSSLSRQVSASADGTWAEIGEQTVAGQRGLRLSDGTRHAVVTADAPHRLLSIALPISVPAAPVPRAYLAQGDGQPRPPPAWQQPTASFTITEPTENKYSKTKDAASAIKKAIGASGMAPRPLGEVIQAYPWLNSPLVGRLALLGIDPTKAIIAGQENGTALLAVLDALTSDIIAATDPVAQQRIRDATLILDKAVRNHQFAALHQVVTSGKLQNPADLKKFMAAIAAIGNKRLLEEVARRTEESRDRDGKTVPGHDVVLDGDYTLGGETYKADILDLTAVEAIQMKTVTGSLGQVEEDFTEAVRQLTGATGERPPPGFTRVVQLNLEHGAADGMGTMDRAGLLPALRNLDLYAKSFINGELVVHRIVVTNFAGTPLDDSSMISRYEFNPEELGEPPPDAAAGPPPAPQPRPSPPKATMSGAPGEVATTGVLVDAASQPPTASPGGIDFSTLELRYLADTTSEYSHSVQYAFTALPATGDQRTDVGLGAAQQTWDAFFVWLGLPTSTFWVNLNPNEPDRIVDAQLGRTDVGRILLEADLQMKKTVAQLIHPDTPLGAEFWQSISTDGGSESCLSFRQWIVPAPATIREDRGALYILDAPLTVQLESDYIQLHGGSNQQTSCARQQQSVERHNEAVLRTLILPRVQQAVNEAPEYSELRRVYLSRVAAEWYRQRSTHEDTAFAGLIDVGDITPWVSRQPWTPRDVFDRYVESYTKGEFNVTRETEQGDVIETNTYIFGGVDLTNIRFHTLSAGDFQNEWPDLASTVKRAFDNPTTDQRGGIWLGSTSTVSSPRQGIGSHFSVYFLLAVIGVAAAVWVRSWWRLRRARPTVG